MRGRPLRAVLSRAQGWQLLLARGIVALTILTASLAPLQSSDAPAQGLYPRSRTVIYATLQELAADNSAVMASQRIGDSWRSRGSSLAADTGLWAFRVGGAPAGQGPALVLIAGQHAREIAGPEILTRLIQRLLVDRNGDPVLGYSLSRVALWIVPLMDPDGYDEVDAGRRDWRKNTNDSNNAPGDSLRALPEGIGVDLNRNFPFGWGLTAPPDQPSGQWHGAGTAPFELDYQGPAASSEPETQAVAAFLQTTLPDVVISYHSPLATVLWPWGHRIGATPDDVPLGTLGRRLAAVYGYSGGQTSRKVGFTTGDITDWSYASIGALAYGVELDGGFRPDEAHLVVLAEETYRTIRYLLAGIAAGDRVAWTAPRITVLDASAVPLPGGSRVTITATVESSLGPITGTVTSVELAVGSPDGQTVSMTPLGAPFPAGDGMAVATIDLPAGRHVLWAFATAAGARGVPTATVVSRLPYQSWVPIVLSR